MKDFTSQLAFITGGASGAGLGQARVFGRAGAKIVIADVRGEQVAHAVADLAAEGIEAHGITLDVTDREAYARAADEVETRFGHSPTLLFNTAGVNSFGPIEQSTFDDFDWLVGVNLGGVINGMVIFVPRMIASGRPGHVVSTSSMGGFQGSALAGPYCAAKAAVTSLMEGYHVSLKPHGIGVSVLCPANIRSNIAEAAKLRPARFSDSGYVENEASIASLHSIHIHGMDPVELAQHVKRCIEEEALYIIPYPEEKERLREHFAAIVDAVLPLEADPEGAARRSEALRAWAADRSRVFMKEEAAG